MTESLMDSLSSSAEITSLRRGIKLKNEAYTTNVLLIMIRQLEKSSEAAANSIASAGSCSLIEKIFDTFCYSQPIVSNALIILNMIIASLSSDLNSAGSIGPICKRLLTQSEHISGLFSAIVAHIEDHTVVVEGVKLLLSLTSEESLLKKILVHHMQHIKSVIPSASDRRVSNEVTTFCISDLIIKIMEVYVKETPLMTQICRIIYNLTYEDDGDMSEGCRSYLSDLGVGELLVTEMMNISIISSGDDTCSSTALDKNSELSEIKDVTILSEGISESVSNGQAIIGQVDIAVESTEQNISPPTPKKGIKKTLSVRTCEGFGTCSPCRVDVGLAKWGLRALGSLSRHHADNQQTFHNLGVCEMVMRLKKQVSSQSELREGKGKEDGKGVGIEEGDGTLGGRDDSSFSESFCWVVGNMADPGDDFSANQDLLIQLGAVEAVLDALKGPALGVAAVGHLAQEGCRALRHLCFENKAGLQKMHDLGGCDVVLDIIRAAFQKSHLSPSSRSPSPMQSGTAAVCASAVQWAWYAITALGSSHEYDPHCPLKRDIRASFGSLGACALLLNTLSLYGSSTLGPGSTDVIQWSLSAMSVLCEDPSNAQRILSGDITQSGSCSSSDVRVGSDRSKAAVGGVDNPNPKSHFSFFSRAVSSNIPDPGPRGVETEGDNEKPLANAVILMKAMSTHLNDEDVAEEFCNAICSLITSPEGDLVTDGDLDLQIPRLRNKQLLIMAGVNELLVKVLVAHEGGGRAGHDSSGAAPVLESACCAISQLTAPLGEIDSLRLPNQPDACSSVDKLVSCGLLRVLSRILALPCALTPSSPLALCGLQVIHDVASCRGAHTHHDAIAKDGAAVCLVSMLHSHTHWVPACSYIARTISLLAQGTHCRKVLQLLRKATSCSALVQAVCVHHKGGNPGVPSEHPHPSLLLLKELLQSLKDLLGADLLQDEHTHLRASLLREGAHEATVLVMRTHGVNLVYGIQSSSIGASNAVVLLCLEILSLLAGTPYSVLEVVDQHSHSMGCLSLLCLPEGCHALDIAPCTNVDDCWGARNEGDIPAFIGSFIVKGAGKESEGAVLGSNICCALGELVAQVVGLLFPGDEAQQGHEGGGSRLSRDGMPDISQMSPPEDGVRDKNGEVEGVGAAMRAADEVTMILSSCCSAIESLVACNRRHRWMLSEAGVIRDLLLAFRLCSLRSGSEVPPNQADTLLMTALCLAIGSISKDIDASAGPRGTRWELDTLSQALPMLCSALDLCMVPTTIQSEQVTAQDSEADGGAAVAVAAVAAVEEASSRCSAALSGSICRTIANIIAAMSQQSVLSLPYQESLRGVEQCVLRSLQRHSSSPSSTFECWKAIAELALCSTESSDNMCTLGVREMLVSAFMMHVPSNKQDSPTPTPIPTPRVVDREAEVYCMVWCRAVFALLRASRHLFFTGAADVGTLGGPQGESQPQGGAQGGAQEGVLVGSLGGSQVGSQAGSQGGIIQDYSLNKEAIASLLLGIASHEGASAAVAGSVCMALSALVTIPCPSDSTGLESLLLEKVVSTIMQKHVAHADWFTFSLQQAAHSISFTKASPTSSRSSIVGASLASTIAAAAAGGVAYWGSVFFYQLLSSRQTDNISTLNDRPPLSQLLILRSKCLSLGVCDVMHRALGKFSHDESVTAACFMAISALLSATGGTEKAVQGVESGGGIETIESSTQLPLTPQNDRCPSPSPSPSSSSSTFNTEVKASEANSGLELALSVASTRRRCAALGLGPMLGDSLREYPSSRQVADWCLRCMSLLLAHSEDTVHRICAAGACETLPVCMQAHQSSVIASISGCIAIYRMIHSTHTPRAFTLIPYTHQHSSVYAIRLGGAGACEAVMSVFRCHTLDPLAVESAARALAALAAVSKGNVGWLGPLGACEVLLAAHDTHQDSSEVVSAVWNAIGALCSCNRERLSDLRAASRVVSSLRSRFQPSKKQSLGGAESSVASSAAFAIGRLCEPLLDASVVNRRALFDAGCCEVLAVVLSVEHAELAASTNIFRAIATMSDGPQCSQERHSFGLHDVCGALAVAMKQHLHHEEAALHGCQAISALCSAGDMTNQRRLRRAGACELVALVLQETVATAVSGVQSSVESSEATTATARTAVDEGAGLFSQMLSRARAYSQPTLQTQTSGKSSVPNPVVPIVPTNGTKFGVHWKEKLKLCVAAVRAISCLSCSSVADREADESGTGSNSAAKALLGTRGVVETLVEVGNNSSWPVEGRDRDRDSSRTLVLIQWVTLALCHLVDPFDDNYHDNDDDDTSEDFNFLKPPISSNLNLTRLCFSNRAGDFLVNSVLSCTVIGSTVPHGEADALVYNALTLMVSMCEDKVGSHRIISSEGLSKMILQVVQRYSSPTSNSTSTGSSSSSSSTNNGNNTGNNPSIETQWLLLLSLSLTSTAALSASLAEKLIHGGMCRLLASSLMAVQFPAAAKTIQQQSSCDSSAQHSRHQSVIGLHLNEFTQGSMTVATADSVIEACDNRMTPGPQCPQPLSARDRSTPDSAFLATPPSHQQSVRSDFETSSFFAPIIQPEEGGNSTPHPGPGSARRVTSAVRNAVRNATLAPMYYGSEVECAYDAESGDVMALALSKESCLALTLLLSACNTPGGAVSEKYPGNKATSSGRMRGFSSAMSLYRDSGGGSVAGIGASSVTSLIDALTTLLLVADSSLLFFSSGNSVSDGGTSTQRNTDSISDNGNAVSDVQSSDGGISRPTPILLPAVKELRDAALLVFNNIQSQQQNQR